MTCRRGPPDPCLKKPIEISFNAVASAVPGEKCVTVDAARTDDIRTEGSSTAGTRAIVGVRSDRWSTLAQRYPDALPSPRHNSTDPSQFRRT